MLKEASDIVKKLTKHFSYTDFQINLITICYTVMVNFDNDIQDIIEYVLATKYILFANANIRKELEKYFPDLKNGDVYELPSFDDKRRYEDDFVVINEKAGSLLVNVLDALIHELKHEMNTVINSYDRTSDNAYINCGLSSVDLEGNYYFRYLEEAFNYYMVYIYLKEVERLKKNDKSSKVITDILNYFSLTLYQYPNLKITKLLEPLFQDKELFRLFYNAALYKDYEALYEALELKLGRSVEYLFDKLLNDYQNGDANTLVYYLDAINVRH